MKQSLLDKTDEELMVLYRNGDEAAFDVLYRRYSGKVYGFLKNRLKGAEQVDDAFQATFLKFHRSRDQFDPSLAFNAWIFAICKSVLVDAIRKSRSEPETFELRTDDDLEERADQHLLVEDALPDLSDLPEAQRKAIEMRYLEDLNFEEIAGKLNTSTNNVRQLVSRGIRQLRNLMSVDGGSDER